MSAGEVSYATCLSTGASTRVRLSLAFILGWIATLAPVLPHTLPAFWLWGVLGGGAVALSLWIEQPVTAQHGAAWLIAACTLLIMLAMLIDFWRLAPELILAQCRTQSGGSLAVTIGRNINAHWNFFFATNIAMLFWVWFMSHPLITPSGRRAAVAARPGALVRRRLCQGLGRCALMLVCMELTMMMVESLARGTGKDMSADSLVSAMLCAMALYHAVLKFSPAPAALVHCAARRIAAVARTLIMSSRG